MGRHRRASLGRRHQPPHLSELVELVTEYVEGTLSPRARERFEEHIMSCRPCRAHLEQMRQTLRLLGSIPEETVPPDVEEALVAAFRGWKRG